MHVLALHGAQKLTHFHLCYGNAMEESRPFQRKHTHTGTHSSTAAAGNPKEKIRGW